MTLSELQSEIHNSILGLRRIQDIVLGPRFGVVWDDSNKEDQLVVLGFIVNRDSDKLKRWVDQKLEGPGLLSLLTVKELRAIAIRKGISPVGMGKGQLLFHIENQRKGLSDAGVRVLGPNETAAIGSRCDGETS